MALEQTQQQIVEHLYRLPGEFKQNYEAGEYNRAAFNYEYTLLIMRAMGMDAAERVELLAEYDQGEVQDAFAKSRRWEDAERSANRKKAVRSGRIF